MSAADAILDDGIVYIRDDSITAVSKTAAPAPNNFESVSTIDTHETIYPKLIDLHDHLSYNALQLWNVPKQFANHDQ